MVKYDPWVQGALGPFYKSGAPDGGNSLPGSMVDPGYPGPLLNMEVRIMDSQGQHAYNSEIEIWHADENGQYDSAGWKYRRSWTVAGLYAGIDVVTALPGIVVYDGTPIYRHVHLLVTPPQPYRGGFNNIEDWRGELLLQLPPWNDSAPTPAEPRSLIKLGGPYTQGFGGRTWYWLRANIYLFYAGT